MKSWTGFGTYLNSFLSWTYYYTCRRSIVCLADSLLAKTLRNLFASFSTYNDKFTALTDSNIKCSANKSWNHLYLTQILIQLASMRWLVTCGAHGIWYRQFRWMCLNRSPRHILTNPFMLLRIFCRRLQ